MKTTKLKNVEMLIKTSEIKKGDAFNDNKYFAVSDSYINDRGVWEVDLGNNMVYGFQGYDAPLYVVRQVEIEKNK